MSAGFICQVHALAVDAYLVGFAGMIAFTAVLVIFGRIAAYVPAARRIAVVGIAFRHDFFFCLRTGLAGFAG